MCVCVDITHRYNKYLLGSGSRRWLSRCIYCSGAVLDNYLCMLRISGVARLSFVYEINCCRSAWNWVQVTTVSQLFFFPPKIEHLDFNDLMENCACNSQVDKEANSFIDDSQRKRRCHRPIVFSQKCCTHCCRRYVCCACIFNGTSIQTFLPFLFCRLEFVVCIWCGNCDYRGLYNGAVRMAAKQTAASETPIKRSIQDDFNFWHIVSER